MKKHPGRLRILKNEGFTLTEILIVIALIGVVATFVVGKLNERFLNAKVEATKNQMRLLGGILDQFKLDCGFYPLTDQSLDALAQKPEGGRECPNYQPGGYFRDGKLPKDGFGRDFIYNSEDGKTYELVSLGNDGQEGGEGPEADISSKNI